MNDGVNLRSFDLKNHILTYLRSTTFGCKGVGNVRRTNLLQRLIFFCEKLFHYFTSINLKIKHNLDPILTTAL